MLGLKIDSPVVVALSDFAGDVNLAMRRSNDPGVIIADSLSLLIGVTGDSTADFDLLGPSEWLAIRVWQSHEHV